MTEVEVVHWNPVRPIVSAPFGSVIRAKRPIGNFGDLLGPVVVDRMLASRGITSRAAPVPARLLAVGSILQYARTGDTVWGSGINGKVPADAHRLRIARRACGARTEDPRRAAGARHRCSGRSTEIPRCCSPISIHACASGPRSRATR